MQILLLFAASMLSAPAAKDKLVSAPVGEWVIEQLEPAVKETDKVLGVYVTIESRRVVYWGAGRVDDEFEARFAANDGVGQLDLINNAERLHLKGIYKLEGDRLVFCLNESSDSPRPTQFKPSKGVSLLFLKKRSD